MEYRNLGRTGLKVTAIGLGTIPTFRAPRAQAVEVIRKSVDLGINYIDTARAYRKGYSEERIGEALKGVRQKVVIATKTRTFDSGEGALKDVETSLKTLGTDHIDVIQLHNLVDEAEWQTALGPGGALEALVEARDRGWVRFIGITGHGTRVADMHRRSLECFPFDSVLLPYNFTMMSTPEYAADFETLVSLCHERGIAVQTIKGITRSPWHDRPHTRNTWYEPLEDQAAIDKAVHWVLGNPSAFLNTAAEISLLPKVFNAISRFTARPSEEEMQSLLTEQAMEPLFA